MSERAGLPLRTPRWLTRLLCAVEVDLERALQGEALSTLGAIDIEERDEWVAGHRTESHRRLRAVLYGPEEDDPR